VEAVLFVDCDVGATLKIQTGLTSSFGRSGLVHPSRSRLGVPGLTSLRNLRISNLGIAMPLRDRHEMDALAALLCRCAMD